MSTAASATAEELALELHEAAVSDAQPEAQSDGSVLIHVIRPCVGQGRGRHLYTAEMLEANAEKFSGWPMYTDHLSPAARRAAGGLPRALADIGGWVEESWWDGSVPADPAKGYGQGAVVARATPFGLAEALIRKNPKIVKTSISAAATGKRPTMHEGQRVMLVEGIADSGSVDWVTEAGAGGEIVSLMESVFEDFAEEGNALLEAMPDEKFMDYLDTARPHLREALTDPNHAEGGEHMGDTITPDMLQEALQSEAGRSLLDGLVKERVDAQVSEVLPGLVEARVEEERDGIKAEAEAAANRKVDLRDMRDAAHAQIDEAKLPSKWATALKGEFSIEESGDATPALDVIDQVDGEGKVTKTARTLLREAVQSKIDDRVGMLQEARATANPTRVKGQGVTKSSLLQEGADGKESKADAPEKGERLEEAGSQWEGTLTGSLLQESGFDLSKGDPWASVR